MIFDFNQTMLIESIIVFPDLVFNVLAKQPSEVKEQIYLCGSNTSGDVSITGSADS